MATPGNNQKRHLTRLLVWRTGTLVLSPAGMRRNAALFVAHLGDLLLRRFRSVLRVYVGGDNAAFHRSRLVEGACGCGGTDRPPLPPPRYAPGRT